MEFQIAGSLLKSKMLLCFFMFYVCPPQLFSLHWFIMQNPANKYYVHDS